MTITREKNSAVNIDVLNQDIKLFPQMYPITKEMRLTHSGVSRLVMLDRETDYGSKEGNKLVDQIFEAIATTAYRASIEIAVEHN